MSDVLEIYGGFMTHGRALGLCMKGEWQGWLFARHPDGQWVSLCKLEQLAAKDARIAELEAVVKASLKKRDDGLIDCLDEIGEGWRKRAEAAEAQLAGITATKPFVGKGGAMTCATCGQDAGDHCRVHFVKDLACQQLRIAELERANEVLRQALATADDLHHSRR